MLHHTQDGDSADYITNLVCIRWESTRRPSKSFLERCPAPFLMYGLGLTEERKAAGRRLAMLNLA